MKSWIATILLALLAAPGFSVWAADCDNPKPLRFARVPTKNADLGHAQYRPLYKKLERVLDRRIEIVQTPSYNAVIEGLLDGTIDLAELGPATYAAAIRRNAEITAFASFSGQRGELFDHSNGYQSVLITRADRGLDTIAKLNGASLSLVDPASTSGALYPRSAIPELTGQSLESYFKRVTFAGSHDRAVDAVKHGLVDAAFVSTTQLDEHIRRGRVRKDEMKIVWKSEIIPFDPFVFRKRICAPLTEKIIKAFLEGQAEMQPMFEQLKNSGFIPVGDETYRAVRNLYDSVQN